MTSFLSGGQIYKWKRVHIAIGQLDTGGSVHPPHTTGPFHHLPTSYLEGILGYPFTNLAEPEAEVSENCNTGTYANEF